MGVIFRAMYGFTISSGSSGSSSSSSSMTFASNSSKKHEQEPPPPHRYSNCSVTKFHSQSHRIDRSDLFVAVVVVAGWNCQISLPLLNVFLVSISFKF